jgi:hypothetical protein
MTELDEIHRWLRWLTWMLALQFVLNLIVLVLT